MKLTKPQLELLQEAAERQYGANAPLNYPPTRKLLDMGLVTGHPQRFGGHTVKITDAGRAALSGS